MPLPPGEETEVTINAPAGEYEYYCTEPGHKDIGMVGTLIVTGDAAATPAVAPEEGAPASEEAADADAAAPAAEEDASAAASADAATVVSHDIFFDPKELSIPGGYRRDGLAAERGRDAAQLRDRRARTSMSTSIPARRKKWSSTPRPGPTSTTAMCPVTRQPAWWGR